MRPLTYERDFFSVNDGKVTLHGWLEERDNNIEGFYEDEGPRHTFTDGYHNEDVHYSDVEEFVGTFYDGRPGTYLPLRDVCDDTPDGDYWCTFDEE